MNRVLMTLASAICLPVTLWAQDPEQRTRLATDHAATAGPEPLQRPPTVLSPDGSRLSFDRETAEARNIMIVPVPEGH
jgi:hypothetical protein